MASGSESEQVEDAGAGYDSDREEDAGSGSKVSYLLWVICIS